MSKVDKVQDLLLHYISTLIRAGYEPEDIADAFVRIFNGQNKSRNQKE